MRDPHTKEPRGFGFVTMENTDEAEAATAALNATEIAGKIITVEKARRGRARTPTPGAYHGPPKRDDERGPPRGGGRYDDRYDRRDSRRDDRGGSYAIPMRDDRRGDDRGYDRYDDRRRSDRYDEYAISLKLTRHT